MDYNAYTQAMQQMLVMNDAYGQTFFTSMLPRIIEAAELRMYREPEFDFLATRTSDTTVSTSTGSRLADIPSKFIVIEGVNLLTPPNATLATGGFQRVSMQRTTRQFIDLTWPQADQTATPNLFDPWYWALFSEQEDPDEGAAAIPNKLIIAPTPDNQYVVEFTGTFRPAALSAGNPNTYLTTYLPDMFLAASMAWAAGALLKNYGAQADDPRQALSWNAVYEALKKAAGIESLRQKYLVGGMSAQPPNPTMPDIAALQQQAAAQQQAG